MNLFSAEAEMAVIGAVMIDASCAPDLFERINPGDFYDPVHRAWWGGMMALSAKGEPLDVVTVAEHMDATGRGEETGGLSALADLVKNTPSSSNVMAYADIVAEMADRRKVIELLPDFDERARNREMPVDQLVAEAQARLGEIIRKAGDDEILPIGSYLGTELLDPLDRRWGGEEDAMGVTLGLKDLDALTLGGRNGDLIIIGARPSMGKTAFMMNIIRKACCEGEVPTFCASMEMKRSQLLERLTAAMADIPIAAIRDPLKNMSDEMWSRLAYPVSRLSEAPLVIDERPGRSIQQIRQEAEKVKERYGRLGLICIDYTGKVRIEGNYGSRHDRGIGEVVSGAKSIAKEFDCPVVLLSQLNRSLEQRTNKRPIMSDLKDSSDMEQEADIIGFLYRDEVYNENSELKGIMEIIIAKQREGETKTVYASARLGHARIDDLAPKSMQEVF